MNKLYATLFALLLSAVGISTAAIAATGRTSGTFDVSKNGTATYRIPISLPPGPRGVQPNLALVYSSDSDAGTMGVGWSLEGLSSILRCNKTYAQDSKPVAVQLQTSDGYCLNGLRLRQVSGSHYGQDNSTYETELTEFSLVAAKGAAGLGPQYFVVQRKDGLTYEYGQTSDSRIIAANSVEMTPYAWLLDKVTDRAGNGYIISYGTGAQGSVGIGVPMTISYTATGSHSSTYTNAINLTYGTNNAAGSKIGYINGLVITNTNLLTGIKVSNGANVIRNYTLTYEVSSTTGRPRLNSIQECSDSGATNCMSPTVISYQNGVAGISTSVPTSIAPVLNSVLHVLTKFDFDGDGRTDIAYYNNGVWYVCFSTSTGYSAPYNTGATTDSGGRMVGSLLGDGKDGFLSNSGGTWWYYAWNGSTFVGTPTGVPLQSGSNFPILADINGDGLPDIIDLVPSSNAYYRRLNASSGTTLQFASTSTSLPINCPSACVFINAGYMSTTTKRNLDLNGDGLEDIVLYRVLNNRSYLYQEFSNGLSYSEGPAFASADALIGWDASGEYPQLVSAGDFNDDGCDDVVDSFNRNAHISWCDGNSGAIWTFNGGPAAIVDWDGDGRSDVLVANLQGASAGYLDAYTSTGNSFSGPIKTNIPWSGYVWSSVSAADSNGDGLTDLIYVKLRSPHQIDALIHDGVGISPDLATSISDGYGVTYSPSYVSIAQGSYTKGNGASYPEQDTQAPRYVVNQVAITDGTGGTHYKYFTYSGAREDLQGRGFEGFQSRTEVDSRPNGLVTSTYYKTAFPYTGFPYQEDVYQHGGTTLISHTVNTLAATTLDGTAYNQRYFPYISNSATDTYEVGGSKNGALVKQSATSYTYDTYGNVTSSTTTVADKDSTAPQSPTYNQSWTTTVTNTITPDNGANWCLNIPTQTVISKTSTVSGESAVTRTMAFTPDYVNCRVTQQIVEPASSAYKVTMDLGYDSFGNVNTQTVTGVGMSPRTNTANWGPTGQFLMSLTNPLNQTTTFTYDFNLGLPTSVTDPNGIRTSLSVYDTFGRKTQETAADGTYTTYSYNDCASVGGGCQNGDPASSATGINKMVIIATQKGTDGTPIRDDWTYLDQFDRPIATRSTTLPLASGATYSRTGTQYDAYGNVARTTVPCDAASCSVYWVTNTYDALNRLTQQQRPINAGNSTLQTTTTEYLGLMTKVTDPQNVVTYRWNDPNGWLRYKHEQSGYSITYAYDAQGSLTKVTDANSWVLFSATYGYGLQAFQTKTVDADLGTWTYTPNALGEVASYKDANTNVFSLTYDALSRPLTRSVAGEGTTTWTWGNSAAGHNIGKLQNLVSTGGTSETYTYDNQGRLTNRNIVADVTYNYDFAYNSTTGLLDTLTYPLSTGGYRLKLQYVYQGGLLSQVKDANASTIFWQANTMSPRGQIAQEALGNGVVTTRAFDPITSWPNSIQSGVGGGTGVQNESYLFDKVGNLKQRQNNTLGLTENFYYDTSYRLTASSLNGINNLTMTYDWPGNITSRSDVAGGATWSYSFAHKHGVTQAGSSAYTYTYDANGNAITRNGYAIGWSKYNYPTSIAGPNETVALSYDANQQRWKQVYTSGAATETTYYIGTAMEKVVTASATDYRHYIYANGRTAVAIMSRASNGTNTTRYVLEDQQDSMAKVTDASGNVTLSESFTAFGNRRNPTTWSGAPAASDLTTSSGITRQGYTWQTALGNLGLNHMNGRVQDAITGRFLSADPFITDSTNTQDYNRYAYARNNPLSLIDPTGFDTCYTMQVYVPGDSYFIDYGDGTGEAVVDAGHYEDQQVCLPDPDVPVYVPTNPGTPNTPSTPNKPTPPPAPRPSLKPQTQNPVKDWLCHAGNYVADFADKLGNVSGKLELTGLGVAGAGAVLAQPEVVAPGLALAATGGAGNIGASLLQFSAGLLQGAGGGGYGNSGYAAASLITGAALSRGILGPSTSGYRTVSQRASDGFRDKTATIMGGANDAYTSWIDAAAPKQVTCPGGN